MISFKSSDKSSRLDWFVRRATSAELLLTFTAGGNPYDTTNVIITVAITSGGNIITPTLINGGVTGLVNLTLTALQTDIQGDEMFWSILIQNPVGIDMMMINGKFVINDYLWDSENLNQDSNIEIII